MDTSSIITLAVAVVLVIAWSGYVYGKRRGEAFHEFARRRGLLFSKSTDIDVEKEFPDLKLFSEGSGKTVSNFIKGEKDGAYVTLFDYRYITGIEQSSTTYSQTVLVIQSGKLDLHSFQLYPENIFSRISSLFGRQDINFQSHIEFSSSYVLRGDDENAVRNMFSGLALSYFAGHKGLNVEGSGQRLLVYRYGSLVRPEEIQSLLTEGIEILRLFERG